MCVSCVANVCSGSAEKPVLTVGQECRPVSINTFDFYYNLQSLLFGRSDYVMSNIITHFFNKN